MFQTTNQYIISHSLTIFPGSPGEMPSDGATSMRRLADSARLRPSAAPPAPPRGSRIAPGDAERYLAMGTS